MAAQEENRKARDADPVGVDAGVAGCLTIAAGGKGFIPPPGTGQDNTAQSGHQSEDNDLVVETKGVGLADDEK